MTPKPRPWRLWLPIAIGGLLALSLGPSPVAGTDGSLVSVATTPITGQEGKVLVITGQPAAGGGAVAACAQIDAPVFQTGLLMKEMPASGDPCAGGTPDASVPDGALTVTAAVYTAGSQSPEKQVTATFIVQGGGAFGVDGVALTADTAGDADCNRRADAVDALHVLRKVAGLSVSAACLDAANLQCDDGFTSVDALLILRHVAALSLNVPTGCPRPLAAPALVSPEDGGEPELPDAPWLVPLDWDPVAGASGYTVEVDCLDCCAAGQYCAEAGRAYRLAADLHETEYTANLAGANPHRWRAWAINEDGTPGDFSEFRTFDILVVQAAR